MLSLDDLALDGASGHYERNLGEGWIYADRIFGPAEDGFGSCTGAIHDRNGNLRASVQTNGRIRSGA